MGGNKMEVLKMPDGKVETIPSPMAFERLVEQHMGSDAAKYYRQQIKELCSCAYDLCQFIGDAGLKAEVEEVIAANGFQ